MRHNKDFHDFEYDERYAYLNKLAEDARWPIIKIEEITNCDNYSEDDEYVPDYSGTYLIDTKLINEGEDGRRYIGCFDYTGHILEAALLGRKEFGSSRKYSFGDTPCWWKEFTPTELEGREIISIDAYINY